MGLQIASCLFLDVDGTLLDLAPRADAVVVPPRLITDLSAAETALDGALALISGRTIDDLDRLFHPLRLRCAGVHGAVMRVETEGRGLDTIGDPLPAEAWQDLTELLREFRGILLENKGF